MSDSHKVAAHPCPKCRANGGDNSGDNLIEFDDGHFHCFACGYQKQPKGGDPSPAPAGGNRSFRPVGGDYKDIPSRGLTADMCRVARLKVGEYQGKEVWVQDNLGPDGKLVGQKLRLAKNKKFKAMGDYGKHGLIGIHQCRDGGKRIVVTEGELDRVSVLSLWDGKWPVVSTANGAEGAKKDFSRSLDELEKFEEVVILFDADEPGQRAAYECAELLSPGKGRIATLVHHKDPNDAWKAGDRSHLLDTIYGARVYRPDGIVSGADLWADVEQDLLSADEMDLPWEAMMDVTGGPRHGELWVFCAGSGVGKSAVLREIGFHLLMGGATIGLLMLEENKKRTATGFMGLHMDRPIHLDRTPFKDLPEDERRTRKRAFEATMGTNRVFLYDHFGSTDEDGLLAKVRYMAKALGAKHIILDHISIVVSGMEDNGDERKTIDRIMTKLRALVEETGIWLGVVSHLKRPEGKGHEEGAATSLSQLRGSHALAQLADMVVGLERNQQGDTPDVVTLRVLKNRFSGETGVAGYLQYDWRTGRLNEIPSPDLREDIPPRRETSRFPDASADDYREVPF